MLAMDLGRQPGCIVSTIHKWKEAENVCYVEKIGSSSKIYRLGVELTLFDLSRSPSSESPYRTSQQRRLHGAAGDGFTYASRGNLVPVE
jgi:hypothetical protein